MGPREAPLMGVWEELWHYLSDLCQDLANQLLPLRVLKAQSQLPNGQGLLEQQAGLRLGWGNGITRSLGMLGQGSGTHRGPHELGSLLGTLRPQQL